MATRKPRIMITIGEDLRKDLEKEMEERGLENLGTTVRAIVKSYLRKKKEEKQALQK